MMDWEIWGYNAGDMPERRMIDLNIPVKLLDEIQEWADGAYMSRNQYIVTALVSGAPAMAEKLGLMPEENKQKLPENIG